MIKKVNGKYFVYSEDGKKLGGPYDSRQQAVKRLQQIEHFKNESITWETKDLKLETQEGWVTMSGTALEVGTSKNDRNYNFENLKDNDGKEFNIIVGHREDYDNPDHIVGEGKYILDGNTLRYEARVKDTKIHPDITEQIKDGLVSVSVQGGFEADERDDGTVDVKNLDIPLLALVGKHVRGVHGASIEAVIEERLSIRKATKESLNEEEEEESNENMEVVNMTDEKVKELEEQLKKLKESNDVLLKAREEAEEKIKLAEKAKVEVEEKAELKAKEDVIESILKFNQELKKEELLEKSLSELKLVESYEKKLANKDTASEVVERDDGAAASDETLKGIVVEKDSKNITMTESRRMKFNEELRNSIYR